MNRKCWIVLLLTLVLSSLCFADSTDGIYEFDAGEVISITYPKTFPYLNSVMIGWRMTDAAGNVKMIGFDDMLSMNGKTTDSPIRFEPEYSTLGQVFNGFYSIIGTYHITSLKDDSMNLDGVGLPRSVAIIGDVAFLNTKMHHVFFEDGSKLLEIGDYAFANSEIRDISIPASIKYLGNGVFFQAEQLASVDLTSCSLLTSIGYRAFAYCDLAEISIPSNITTIGDYAFAYCESLETVSFTPESQLTTIGTAAFKSSGVTNMSFPASVEIIGERAFMDCSNLLRIKFAEDSKLFSIESRSFMNSRLFVSITLPASLKSIGDYAFYNNTLIFNVYFDGTSELETIGDYAFYNTQLLFFDEPPNLQHVGENALGNNYKF